MTIFLELVKKFLIADITLIRNKSVSADNSAINYFASCIGAGRDKGLATLKREYADELLRALRDLDDKQNDEETCEEIKRLITDCRKKGKTAAIGIAPDEGKFGPGMLDAISLLEDLFEKLKTVQLLNFPHDKDPMNIFRYHMAHYFLTRVAEKRHTSLFTRISTNPQLITSSNLVMEKEKAIIIVLQSCCEDLADIKTDIPNYISKRETRVLEWIMKLSRANHTLCNGHSSSTNLPIISLGFFASLNVETPSMGPSPGLLGKYLKNARVEIRPELLVEHKVEDSLNY